MTKTTIHQYLKLFHVWFEVTERERVRMKIDGGVVFG